MGFSGCGGGSRFALKVTQSATYLGGMHDVTEMTQDDEDREKLTDNNEEGEEERRKETGLH